MKTLKILATAVLLAGTFVATSASADTCLEKLPTGATFEWVFVNQFFGTCYYTNQERYNISRPRTFTGPWRDGVVPNTKGCGKPYSGTATTCIFGY